MSKKSIVITGAAGFMGLEFLKQALEKTDYNIICIDAMTYAANEEAFWKEVSLHKQKRVIICQQKIQNIAVYWKKVLDEHNIKYVFNFAAESHVDNSNEDGTPFVESNILGTYNLVEYMRNNHPELKCFFQISTDEVYGMSYNVNFRQETAGLPDDYLENNDYNPTSYYAASKASAEMFVKSASKVWNFPYIITRSCNNFGPFQHIEKLIPKFLKNMILGISFPLYGDGKQLRQWVSSARHAECLIELMKAVEGTFIETNQIFNIGGIQMENLELIDKLMTAIQKSENKGLLDSSYDRPGHDLAYNLNSTKLDKLVGEYTKERFEKELSQTVNFYSEKFTHESFDREYEWS